MLYPHKLYDVLLHVNEAFLRKFGRPVRLWLDKVCVMTERTVEVTVVRGRDLPEMVRHRM